MSIPEDVAMQLHIANKRIVELESDFEVASELIDNLQMTIRKLQVELGHHMGGKLSQQLLELKATRRMLCVLVVKFGGIASEVRVSDRDVLELAEDAELIVHEKPYDAQTLLRVRNVPLIDRLKAIKDRLNLPKTGRFSSYKQNNP